MTNERTPVHVAEKLIEFRKSLSKAEEREIAFTPNEEANRFVNQNTLAFVLGVLFDERRGAEKVWEAPFKLSQRLGGLNPRAIAGMSDEEMIRVFEEAGLRFLSRYKTMAVGARDMCREIIGRYKGNAENIWNDKPRANDLQGRFKEFDGINQKKASMAVNILISRFGIDVTGGKERADISYDRHVRRVFLRTGLVEKDNRKLMIQAARKLNPEYPGELDLPSWHIGRKWCRPINPDCKNCPISEACPRFTHLGKEIG